MSPRSAALVLLTAGVLTGSLLVAPAWAGQAADTDPRWAQAAELENGGQWEEAIPVYGSILADDPASQKAMIRRAAARYEAGQLRQALEDIESGIELNPHSRVWAEWGYLYKARVCARSHREAEAREAIALMKSRFPDSISTARAEVLEAELDGRDTAAAEQAVALEEEAEALHERANAASKAGDAEEALRLFDQVIAEYPTTRKSLRSMEIKALLLGLLPDRRGEAIRAWQVVLARVGESAPQARIVQEARMRLAALYHASLRKVEALEMYARLADEATNPEVISNSALQAAGLQFELFQAQHWQGAEIPAGTWAEIRRMCGRVMELGFAKPEELVTARLMVMETYLWEGRAQECLALAESFIAGRDAVEQRRVLATAHLFAGESLQRLRRHAEALEHYRWILAEEEAGGTPWPVEYLLARTHYRVYDALKRSGAPPREVAAAAELVLERFPDSVSAELARRSLAAEGEQ